MKTKLILLITILSFGYSKAQEINCSSAIDELAKLIDSQNYKEASVKMNVLLNKCAANDEKLYILSAKVIQNKVDLSSNDDKQKAVKELIALFDKHDKLFPNNTSNNDITKAMLYYDYDIANEEETFAVFDKAFAKDKFRFENPSALNTYFKLFNENYKKSENSNFDLMFEKYSQVMAVVEKNKLISNDKKVEFDNVKLSVYSIVKNYLTADNLVDYAERNIKKNQTNAEWLSPMVDLMLECCSDKTVFGSVAFYLHSIQPSSKSAYALGAYNLKSNNKEKAIEYLQLAAELTTDKNEKARIYSNNASILFGFDKKAANQSALLAIQNDATNGEYYIFLSNLYASAAKECGTSTIEQKTVYYLANKYAQKAAEIQPMFKTTANVLSEQYKKFDFTTKELEQIKKSGNKVILECWINQTVQF